MIREIEADAKAFGDERRTLIEAQKRAVAEVRVVDEPVTVVVSMKGWVRALKGHEVDPAQLAFKAGDALYGTFACRSIDALLVFGSNGRVYSVAVASLPSGRGDGQPITSLIDVEPGTQPAHYFAGAGSEVLMLAGTGGFGLLARASDLVSRQRGGKAFLVLEGEEKPLPPAVVGADAARVACLTLAGRLLVFGLDELKLQGNGGRGLTLIDLDVKDALVSVAVFATALRVVGTGRGGKARDEVLRGAALDDYIGRRARKGRRQHVLPNADARRRRRRAAPRRRRARRRARLRRCARRRDPRAATMRRAKRHDERERATSIGRSGQAPGTQSSTAALGRRDPAARGSAQVARASKRREESVELRRGDDPVGEGEVARRRLGGDELLPERCSDAAAREEQGERSGDASAGRAAPDDSEQRERGDRQEDDPLQDAPRARLHAERMLRHERCDDSADRCDGDEAEQRCRRTRQRAGPHSAACATSSISTQAPSGSCATP